MTDAERETVRELLARRQPRPLTESQLAALAGFIGLHARGENLLHPERGLQVYCPMSTLRSLVLRGLVTVTPTEAGLEAYRDAMPGWDGFHGKKEG